MHPIVAKYEGIIAMKTINTAVHRYHDICMGHRVVGHEGKCRHLHGHNYRIHFYCEAKQKGAQPDECAAHDQGHSFWDGQYDYCGIPRVEYEAEKQLDSVGRVIDFSVMKEKLCMWLEENWDHKFLHWNEDPIIKSVYYASCGELEFSQAQLLQQSFVSVPFNPTAENIAHHLLTVIAPQQLADTNVVCTKVVVEETAKCAVTAQLEE